MSDGRGGQDDATVTINVSNTPPTATINSPGSTVKWAVGETISFSGAGTDPQDGTIPGSRMNWALIMHHCPSTCHEHQITSFTGTSGSFTAPDHEYPSHLELRLTVTDAQGLTDTESVTLQPKTVQLTFQSSPSGLQLGFNSEQATTPFTRTVIVGSANSVSAPSPQTRNGTAYGFASWSDGGTAGHNIIAPANATAYTATYTPTTTDSGLVAAYGMNEGTGSAVADSSGRGNNGTATDTTWSTSGKYGKALTFNGNSSWVTVADSPSLRLSGAMTMQAWVKPAAGKRLGHRHAEGARQRPGLRAVHP
nr:hypothetical protein GCM10020093_081550 [Planobispora longispora]